MSKINYVDQTKKPEDFPNEVYFCFTNEGELQSTANESTVTYIRTDIALRREKEIILYLLNQYAPKPMGRTCQQTFMGLDVLKVYGEMGLGKLK